jgi:hypothetical protein
VAGLATDLATSGVLRRAALWRFARGEYGYIPTAPTRADDLPAILGDCAEGCDGQAAIQLLDHVLRYLAPPQFSQHLCAALPASRSRRLAGDGLGGPSRC